MKVHLRAKKITKNRKSLYLEYYESGKREFETLSLYIYDKKRLSQVEKDHNKQILETAKAIQSKRILEIKNNEFGFLNKNSNNSFIEYYKKTAYSKGNFHIAAFKCFVRYLRGKEITFSNLDVNLMEKYRTYLLESKTIKTSNLSLSVLNYQAFQ
jgi:hypothetical protein